MNVLDGPYVGFRLPGQSRSSKNVRSLRMNSTRENRQLKGLLRTHGRRKRTPAESGSTPSDLSGPNACIRSALCWVWAAETPVCLVMRSLPRKMRPEQQKTRTLFRSLCVFPADSRSPPECTPHSKAIKNLMRYWLRLFFSSFLTPCFRSGDICLIWSFK